MKTWEKPQLIVLIRGKPEEAVLTLCKHSVFTQDGPNYSVVGCHPLIIGSGCSTECSGSHPT